MAERNEAVKHFPEDFKFGVATSAYQIEGAWNVDGKSESLWDHYTHTCPDRIKDRTNGDTACDAYNQLDADVANIARLKVHFYRFSISWCRILPTGFPDRVNAAGVDYYNRLIDKLLAHGVEPVATLFHWDLPLNLHRLGGWCNFLVADWFAGYARVCFRHFGDRVKTWITINEPHVVALRAYGGAQLAPSYDMRGVGSYIAAHGQLLAHMKAYRVYDEEFREEQRGRVGITTDLRWAEPATDAPLDRAARDRYLLMDAGWICEPIFGRVGDYPAAMRATIERLSRAQGYAHSRLPTFGEAEVRALRRSSDFFGLNHYNTVAVRHGNAEAPPTNQNDMDVTSYYDPSWRRACSDLFRVTPWGFRKLLNWIRVEYDNPEVIVFENGYAGMADESLDDAQRISYVKEYLEALSDAILKDGCNVTGYTFWSLMDNYEWQNGYTVKFGLYHVDFNDPERKRTPKRSAFVYQDIAVTKCLTNPIPTKFLH